MQAAVPLWKVIVGAPTPANSNRARKGPVLLQVRAHRPDAPVRRTVA
jgi:hypothetical protein